MSFKSLPGKNPRPLEKEVLKSCLAWLTSTGWLVWRNNTGASTRTDASGRTRMMRFGRVGSSDIFAIRDGVFLSVETKREGNSPTEKQEQWAADVRRHGGIAVVAHSLQELIDALEGIHA